MSTVVETPVASPEVLYWDDFSEMFRTSHRQGEHVAIVGPTGSGKSVLALELCVLIGSRMGKDGRPSRVTILAIKPRDDTLSALISRGWKVIKKWPPAYGEEHCIVWPRGVRASESAERHRTIFLPLMDTIYQEGGQTVEISEAAYFERQEPSGLGMGGTMERFWAEARSNKVSLVAETQRPRNVTRLMWSEPSWVIVFPPEDVEDLKRVAELSGQREAVLEAASRLGGYEFLCIRRQRDGQRGLYVSKVGVRPIPSRSPAETAAPSRLRQLLDRRRSAKA